MGSQGVGVLRLGGLVGGRDGFWIVGEVETFGEEAREIVDVIAIFLAALLQKKKLAEIAEGGGAARGNTVGGQGAEGAR